MSKQTELAQVADTITVNSGKIGIGTDSPAELLNLSAAEPVMRFTDSDDNNYHHLFSSSDDFYISADRNNTGSGNLIFRNGGTSERMRIDSAGRVTMPYQPAFMAYAGGDVGFNAPQSTWADLNVFGSVNHNRGNHYNSSTCNFTCPVSGVYHFYVNVREETYYGSWGGIHIQLVTNGSRFAEIRKWDGYQNEETLTLSVTRQFSANDVVGVRVHSDSSDTNLAVEGGTTTFFGGHLLG